MPGPMTQASRLKKVSGLVQHLIRAALVKIVELAGIKILNLLYTVNINMTHVFKHPKFYRSFKQQASSTKQIKNLGTRIITRATSIKLQAPSSKLSYIFSLIKFWKHGTGIMD